MTLQVAYSKVLIATFAEVAEKPFKAPKFIFKSLKLIG